MTEAESLLLASARAYADTVRVSGLDSEEARESARALRNTALAQGSFVGHPNARVRLLQEQLALAVGGPPPDFVVVVALYGGLTRAHTSFSEGSNLESAIDGLLSQLRRLIRRLAEKR